jgi:hypothetical protein
VAVEGMIGAGFLVAPHPRKQVMVLDPEKKGRRVSGKRDSALPAGSCWCRTPSRNLACSPTGRRCTAGCNSRCPGGENVGERTGARLPLVMLSSQPPRIKASPREWNLSATDSPNHHRLGPCVGAFRLPLSPGFHDSSRQSSGWRGATQISLTNPVAHRRMMGWGGGNRCRREGCASGLAHSL